MNIRFFAGTAASGSVSGSKLASLIAAGQPYSNFLRVVLSDQSVRVLEAVVSDKEYSPCSGAVCVTKSAVMPVSGRITRIGLCYENGTETIGVNIGADAAVGTTVSASISITLGGGFTACDGFYAALTGSAAFGAVTISAVKSGGAAASGGATVSASGPSLRLSMLTSAGRTRRITVARAGEVFFEGRAGGVVSAGQYDVLPAAAGVVEIGQERIQSVTFAPESADAELAALPSFIGESSAFPFCGSRVGGCGEFTAVASPHEVKIVSGDGRTLHSVTAHASEYVAGFAVARDGAAAVAFGSVIKAAGCVIPFAATSVHIAADGGGHIVYALGGGTLRGWRISGGQYEEAFSFTSSALAVNGCGKKVAALFAGSVAVYDSVGGLVKSYAVSCVSAVCRGARFFAAEAAGGYKIITDTGAQFTLPGRPYWAGGRLIGCDDGIYALGATGLTKISDAVVENGWASGDDLYEVTGASVARYPLYALKYLLLSSDFSVGTNQSFTAYADTGIGQTDSPYTLTLSITFS